MSYLDDYNFQWLNIQFSKFCFYVERTQLGNNEEVSIRIIEAPEKEVNNCCNKHCPQLGTNIYPPPKKIKTIKCCTVYMFYADVFTIRNFPCMFTGQCKDMHVP